MDPEDNGAPAFLMCLNCMKKFTMNSLPFAPKLESGEPDDLNDPVYLISISYNLNGRNPETGAGEIKTVTMTNIEMLTYVFELPPSEVSRLINLQVNSMSMCGDCTQILASVFKARYEFQQLTSRSSCLYSLVSRLQEQEPTTLLAGVLSKSTRTTATAKANGCNRIRPTKNRNVNQVVKSEILDHPSSLKIEEPEFIHEETIDLLLRNQQVLGKALQRVQTESTESGVGETWEMPSSAVGVAKTSSLEELDSDRNYIQKLDSSQMEGSEKPKLKQMPPKKQFSCRLCGEVFHKSNKKWTLRRHNETKHGQTPAFSCGICGQPCAGPTSLKRHIMKHSVPEERPKISCSTCGKTFLSTSTNNAKHVLRRHNETKHGQPPAFPCDICGRPCDGAAFLKMHRLTHNPPEERTDATFLCPDCGKQLKSKHGLEYHISKVHRKDFKYPEFHCEKCGADYRSRAEYKTHLNRHGIEEGDTYYFFCKMCPAKFKFKEDFRNHGPACPAEAHLRPHVCPECSRRFKLKQALELHLNDVHKYSSIKAREFVYPGRGPRSFLTRADVKSKKKIMTA